MASIIETAGLRKVYSKRRGEDVVAVESLDLTVGRPGTVHGFLGPNGSGKTTSIRCLLGLIRPSSGSARLFGVDSTTSFHEVAHRVGAIVENPKLFPNFTARRNLSLLADLAGVPSSEIDRVLDIVGLTGRDDDTFDSYSLGMKQRLAIAAALLKKPELLVLDEPANGLDPAGIAEMRLLIRSIASEGTSILVSSHQLAEIEQVCDEVTIIDRGRLVTSGSIDEVRRHAGPDTVVVTVTDPAAAAAALSAGGLGARPRPDAHELSVDIDASQTARVTEVLANAGIYLTGLRADRATLEDAFLNLTGHAPPPPNMAAQSGAPTGPPGAPGPPGPPGPPTLADGPTAGGRP